MPEDWVFFDVPMLLTLRDKMWVRGISRALVEQFKRDIERKQNKAVSILDEARKNGWMKSAEAFHGKPSQV